MATAPGYKIWENTLALTTAASPLVSAWYDTTGYTSLLLAYTFTTGTTVFTIEGSYLGSHFYADELLPAIEAMGRRHSGYGVREEHYTTVATALLWTLEQGLGPAFTPEVRSAWVETYTILSAVMQRGARLAA